ncbi:MAG: DUF2341 domain-containing protein [Candidatus Shapirobacteria bacterium]|nr:DUF2341 domain-containing protein [Candidatus Shapirobacteria bacterium]
MKRLQSLSYKTLFTILFLSLAGIVFFIRIGGNTQKVSAAWWDEMWHYRKAISISNTSGSDLTDFQVSVSIGTSQLIADGKMQTDCDDIRITDINGNLLPHWIETNGLNSCNQLNSVVWIKATSLPTSGSTLYVYYGNSSANSTSNGNNVFIFFDDFNGSFVNTDKWDNTGNMLSISNNRLRADRVNGTGSLFSKVTFARPFVLDYDFYPTQYPSGWEGTYHGSINFGTFDGSKNSEHTWTPYGGGGNSYCGFCDDGGCYHGQYVNPVVTGDTLYKISMQAKTLQSGPQGVMTYSNRKDDNIGSQANDTIYTGATTGADPLYIGIKDYGGNTSDDFEWDNWRVRKYASLDPTPTLQSEELSPAPIAYWKFDEGSGTTAYDSFRKKNGTLINPSWATEEQCISEKCLLFDGIDDYVNVGTGNDYFPLPTLSACAWIKTSGLGVSMTINGILSITYGFSMFLNSSGQFSTRMDDGISIPTHTITSVNLHDNKYHHLCLTYDGTNKYMYIDGIQKLSIGTTWLGTTRWPTNTVNIGHENNNSAFYKFNGHIDEVKIYPYARTADQIKQDYNSRGSLSGSGVNLGGNKFITPEGLIGYWNLDGNINDSSNNNLQTSFGSIQPQVVDAKFNKGYQFTTDSTNEYIYINPNESLNFTNNFSASFWFKASTRSSYQSIIGEGLDNGWGVFLNSSGTELFFRINNTSSTSTSVSVVPNTWYHVVVTYDGNHMRIYLNSNMANSIEKTGNLTHIGNGIGIGRIPDRSYPLNGTVDDIRLYNYSLPETEVQKLYNQENPLYSSSTAIQFGSTNQTIDGTTTSLEYCIPGDTSYCAPPIAEWKMNEGVGTSAIDTSGNNNTGSLVNSPSWVQGKIGKAINFNGNNKRVTITNPITSSGYSTLSLWYKRSETDASTSWRTLVGHATANIHHLILNNSTRNIGIFDGAWKDFGYNPLNDNKWHHYEVIYNNGTNATLYVDGVYKNQISTTLDLSTNPIGSIGNWSGGGYWAGPIDHIRIYNYARTPAQIAYDYNKGGPVGWWKFDECQGNIAYDWSGIGNTGTIVVGASGTQNSLGTCAVGTSAAWTNGASGKINSSLNFDGTDDYVSVINNNLFNFSTNDFTISLWAKKTTNTFQQYGPLISKGIYSGVGEWNLYEYGSNNSWNLYCNGSNNFRFNADIGEKWGHILIGRRMDQMFIYFNGQITNPTSDTISGNNIDFTNTKNLTIGTRNNGSSYFFNGQIDDVRIYNYALTSEQIKQVYNGGSVNFR